MINFALFAAAYCLFHATHGIADYWVQRDWQAQNKSKKGLLDGNWAVWSHATEYTLCFIPALWLLGVTWEDMWIPLLSILLPHAWMDTRRFLTWFVHKTKGWKHGDISRMLEGKFHGQYGREVCTTADGSLGCCADHIGVDKTAEQALFAAAVRVHVTIHMDQHFHKACLAIVAAYIAWR